jgi:hypothetical protein
MRRFFLSLAICMMALTFSVNSVAADNFSWRGATVYFLVTDRFANGETSNDVNYGRKVDYGSEQMNAATFHGGDLKGILQKAREGYFTQMGIDVLWMTDVYEQLHGWIAGSGKINDFPHYGYHGYYPLDYTQMDKNYGTIEEMRELVNTLHAQGIRVMQQIADQLCISANTVNNHRQNIMHKLHCKNTTEAIDVARRLGLLPQK